MKMNVKFHVNLHLFQNAFEGMNRKNQFSYEALLALFEHLEQWEQDTGEEIELDVIALCCAYREIKDDEEDYQNYINNGDFESLVIATLPSSILVLADQS